MMSYIKALQHILVIENGQHSYRINDAQELGSILALIRKEKQFHRELWLKNWFCVFYNS